MAIIIYLRKKVLCCLFFIYLYIFTFTHNDSDNDTYRCRQYCRYYNPKFDPHSSCFGQMCHRH